MSAWVQGARCSVRVARCWWSCAACNLGQSGAGGHGLKKATALVASIAPEQVPGDQGAPGQKAVARGPEVGVPGQKIFAWASMRREQGWELRHRTRVKSVPLHLGLPVHWPAINRSTLHRAREFVAIATDDYCQ